MTDSPDSRDEDTARDASNPRREMIVLGAQAAVGVGLLAAMWPFFAQLGPNRGTRRVDIITVDLSTIPEGDTRLLNWHGQPVFVRHRSFAEIERARTVLPQPLRDPLARNAALDASQPARDDNRVLPGHTRWLVVGGACTHLGCLLHSRPAADRIADGAGWQCPCHSSRFDLSGRVLDGPATANLPVPIYSINGNELSIGATRG